MDDYKCLFSVHQFPELKQMTYQPRAFFIPLNT